jgi:radical SAM protein with 4Fe4S-binding SPASM domain
MLDVKFKLFPGHVSERSWMDPSPLRKLFWNVTYACNQRCPICFSDSAKSRGDELNTAEAMALVRQAASAGVRDIIVSGGEPFSRGDMIAILAAMAAGGISARIASNGTLLNPVLLDRLRAETRTQSFQVSLDSLAPEIYGRMHGVPGTALADALAAVRAIRDRGFHTTVSARLTPATAAGIPALLDRAAAEGWATVTVHWPVHNGRSRGTFPRDADFFALLEPVFEHFAAMRARWLVETYVPWAPYHPTVRHLESRIRFVHCGCRAGRDRLSIGPSGQIQLCVCADTPAAHLGNVRRDNLADVYASSPLCRMMRQPWEHRICADCPHVKTCGGGCRAAALAMTGRIDADDLGCPRRAAARKEQRARTGAASSGTNRTGGR